MMKSFGLALVLLLTGCDEGYLDHDIKKSQRISCSNNLKQIGLAFKIWAGDHSDLYPFNASTNAGGTLELCERGADGFDRNSFLHFQVMANELSTPKVICCPNDPVKKFATNWGSLSAANVSYQLRSGTNVGDSYPRAILAVCPVDGNILYCDGTVTGKNGGSPAGSENGAQPVAAETSGASYYFMVMSNEPKASETELKYKISQQPDKP